MNILHLEDDPRDAEFFRGVIEAEIPGCSISAVSNREAWFAGLAAGPDIILSDFSTPGFGGMEVLAAARELAPDVPFIFLSGTIGEERALQALRQGAYDHVLKDTPARLVPALSRARREVELRKFRVESQQRLRELAEIIDRTAEAIVMCDLEGRVTYWNRGAERLYGIATDRALHRRVEDLFPDLELDLHLAREAVARRGEWQGEIWINTEKRGRVAVDAHVTLVRDEDGRPKARLSIAVDVSEQLKLKEQVLRGQRLENIGLLAAGIAHDLNNVLAPVLMSAPLLRRHAADPLDLRLLESLEKSAVRGARLVRQLLGFAHGAGSDLRPMQVKHLIRDIGDIAEASFPKSIVVEENVKSDLWAVHGNPTQIHQVILNLAVNARDAMLPGSGLLSISAWNQVLTETEAHAIEGGRAGAFVVLEVRDTGPGIAAEIFPRIWEPFFTTKGEGKGTGLGLSTVRGIVGTHHGFIAVDTAPGRGAAFRVYLPSADGGVDSTAPFGVELPRANGELILVVDDDDAVREAACSILVHHGYRVKAATDGVEAIGLVAECAAEIRLVITDLNMPHLDGPALARVLHRLQPGVQVLAMTGLGCEKFAGDENFVGSRLQKPFTAQALLRAVHTLIVSTPERR